MARYIAKERGQIPADGALPVRRPDSSPTRRVMRLVEPGEEFEFHGKPGKWMEPVKGGSAGNAQPGRQRAVKAQEGQSGQDGSPGKKPSSGESPAGPASQS